MADSQVLNTLRSEKATLTQQIAKVEAHLEMLRGRLKVIDESLANIEPFYGEQQGDFLSEPLGTTDAIRDVYRLSERNKYLSPTEVRDNLKAAGRLRGYENEMAVIHQVIRRLMEQGQIEAHPREKLHRWIWPQSSGMLSESKSNVKPVTTVTARRRTGKDFLI